MAQRRKMAGVRTARVVDNVDPQGGTRLQVEVAGQRPSTSWARLATLSAGNGRGTWFRPAVGDEVLVAFEGGDPSLPIVVGSLWGSADTPPETGASADRRTTIRTRSGALVRIEDASEQSPTTITIETGSGDRVEIGQTGITIASSNRVVVTAAAVIELTSSAVQVNTGISRFSGVVQCDTLVATSVVAASYTPGTGNLV